MSTSEAIGECCVETLAGAVELAQEYRARAGPEAPTVVIHVHAEAPCEVHATSSEIQVVLKGGTLFRPGHDVESCTCLICSQLREQMVRRLHDQISREMLGGGQRPSGVDLLRRAQPEQMARLYDEPDNLGGMTHAEYAARYPLQRRAKHGGN